MKRHHFRLILAGCLLAGPAAAAAEKAVPAAVLTIIKGNCSTARCHQGRYPAGNLNLEADKFLASTLNVASEDLPGKKLIDTTTPEDSYLLAKVRGAPGIVGGRMPARRNPLTEAEITALESWILSLKDAPAPSAGVAAGAEGHGPRTEEQRPAAATRPRFTRPAFWGTRLVNLPTAETVDKGRFLFRISHRFLPDVASGWDGFLGLDGPAFILFSLGYGISDRLTVTVGRTNFDQEWEFAGDYRVFEPSGQTGPGLSGTLHLGGSVVTQDRPAGQDWSGRFRLSALFSFSWQISDRISLLAVPGFASNTNYFQPDSEGTFSLGLGGRARLLGDLSAIAEWVPVLAGYKDYRNGWGLGLEKKIGGHVFQVFVTNDYGLTAPQYLIGGDLGRFTSGLFHEFRLGFNIFRIF